MFFSPSFVLHQLYANVLYSRSVIPFPQVQVLPRYENGKLYVEVGMSDMDLDSTRYKYLEIYFLNKIDQ